MNLELIGVEGAGDLETERVVLRVKVDLDVGRYAILQGIKISGKNMVGSGPVAAFWIPDKKVKAGDFVVVYTKQGTMSEKAGEKNASHFFYWWSNTTLWSPKTTPVVLEITGWKFNIPAAELSQPQKATSS